MTTLTVTRKGQVTLRKDILRHLGIEPGDQIAIELLPDGRGMLTASRPTESIDGFIGLLAGRTKKVATLEEIEAAASEGWVGR